MRVQVSIRPESIFWAVFVRICTGTTRIPVLPGLKATTILKKVSGFPVVKNFVTITDVVVEG